MTIFFCHRAGVCSTHFHLARISKSLDAQSSRDISLTLQRSSQWKWSWSNKTSRPAESHHFIQRKIVVHTDAHSSFILVATARGKTVHTWQPSSCTPISQTQCVSPVQQGFASPLQQGYWFETVSSTDDALVLSMQHLKAGWSRLWQKSSCKTVDIRFIPFLLWLFSRHTAGKISCSPVGGKLKRCTKISVVSNSSSNI